MTFLLGDLAMNTLKTVAAAALLLAHSAAIAAAPSPEGPPIRLTGAKADPNKKKICRSEADIGTRLGGKTICRTAGEWAAVRAEARRTVERIQDFKPSICRPGDPC
jgi:hypothetical protein